MSIDKPTPAAHGEATDLREDELVCPVTYLVYLKGTPNPHIDNDRKATMTTTDADLNIKDVYSHDQLARLAALQRVATSAKGVLSTTNPDALIKLAEYVIGDDEPFNPVALAHEAREALAVESGHYGDEPLADWERELLAMAMAMEEHVVGDITVSDLAGFLTLPLDATLEDEDGDTWRHEYGGWVYAVGYAPRIPAEIFMDFGHGSGQQYSFVVTNPEVLS